LRSSFFSLASLVSIDVQISSAIFTFYRAFHSSGQAKFPDGGLVLSFSKFSILTQLPPKILLNSKVISICLFNSVTHSVQNREEKRRKVVRFAAHVVISEVTENANNKSANASSSDKKLQKSYDFQVITQSAKRSGKIFSHALIHSCCCCCPHSNKTSSLILKCFSKQIYI